MINIFTDKLHTLREIRAPKELKSRIKRSIADLPSKHQGFSFPLFALQHALVVGVLILLIGVGSGIFAAEHFSRPGQPLYPVHQAITSISQAMQFGNRSLPPITPMPSPIKPQQRVATSSGENQPTPSVTSQENHGQNTARNTQGKNDVKGISNWNRWNNAFNNSIQQFKHFFHGKNYSHHSDN